MYTLGEQTEHLRAQDWPEQSTLIPQSDFVEFDLQMSGAWPKKKDDSDVNYKVLRWAGGINFWASNIRAALWSLVKTELFMWLISLKGIDGQREEWLQRFKSKTA